MKPDKETHVEQLGTVLRKAEEPEIIAKLIDCIGAWKEHVSEDILRRK